LQQPAEGHHKFDLWPDNGYFAVYRLWQWSAAIAIWHKSHVLTRNNSRRLAASGVRKEVKVKDRNRGRRDFLATTARGAVGAGLALSASNWRSVLGASDRVRLGIIGAGARGQEIMREALRVPNVDFVAMADVYTRRHEEVKKLVPGI